MKIAFIGGGVMAEAIISGLISKGSAGSGDITVSDIAQIALRIWGLNTVFNALQVIRKPSKIKMWSCSL